MRDFVRKPRNWFIVMVVVAVLSALMISFFSSFNTNLPSYNGTNTVVEPPVSTEPPVELDTKQHISEEYGFSMDVPTDWVYAVRNGCDSYINSADGAIVSFAVSAYDPYLNMITEQTVASEVMSADGLIGAFSWISNSCYVTIYEIGSLDYFEYSTWDLDTLIRVSVQTPAARYTEYRDMILSLFDTFVWNSAYPIPEGYIMYYSDYGHFEFPIPDGWMYELQDGQLTAYSDDGINLRIALSSTTEGLGDIAQYDYAAAMSSGKADYMLTAYSATESVLSAEAYFTANGIQYAEAHNILATGEFQYEILLQCPYELLDRGRQVNAIVTQYFRVF